MGNTPLTSWVSISQARTLRLGRASRRTLAHGSPHLRSATSDSFTFTRSKRLPRTPIGCIVFATHLRELSLDCHQVTRCCVPKVDRRRFRALVRMPENAQRSGKNGESARMRHREVEPSRRQRRSEVAVRKQGDGPIQLSKPGDHAIHALRHGLRAFSFRTTVSKQIPARVRRLNLRRPQAFKSAIIPFGDIGRHLGSRATA